MENTRYITLSGHAEAIPLSSTAYEGLLRYLADARQALSADPDGDETVRDLEASIGVKMRGALDASGAPINDTTMGRLLAEAGTIPRQPDTVGHTRPPSRGPFWCRIDEGKWFGGLCLGIAARGGFRVDWVRTIAIFLGLVTGGLIGLVYLVLLLLVPRVDNLEEYRRLRDAPRVDPGRS